MSDTLQKWLNNILDLFASCSPGVGMKYQTIESKFGRTFGKDRIEFLFVYYNLLENEILAQDERNFVSLTEKGFEFINGDEQTPLRIYFEIIKHLSKNNKEELFANLWHIIGQDGKCLCYVGGTDFFNAISIFLPVLGSYSEYMKELHEINGNTSRISWYKDLFYQLPTEAVEQFLGKLSDSYNQAVSNVQPSKDDNEVADPFPDLQVVEMSNNINESQMNKPNKIFISQCRKDKAVVDRLVDLLGEIINLNKDNLFCSSVHGFDVILGENFMDNIMEQYKQNNLFLIYVLSHNYMGSPICLNEMGASWMTMTNGIGILLPDFEIDELGNSCYDKQTISVIFNQDDAEVKHRLNQLKEIVEKLFPEDDKNIDLTRWEEKRDGFIRLVRANSTIIKEESSESNSAEAITLVPQASLASSTLYNGKGIYNITFRNQGSGSATNLSIEFEDVEGIVLMIDKDLFPFELLKPGREFQIHAVMMEGASRKMMAHMKWNEGDAHFEDDELVVFNH